MKILGQPCRGPRPRAADVFPHRIYSNQSTISNEKNSPRDGMPMVASWLRDCSRCLLRTNSASANAISSLLGNFTEASWSAATKGTQLVQSLCEMGVHCSQRSGKLHIPQLNNYQRLQKCSSGPDHWQVGLRKSVCGISWDFQNNVQATPRQKSMMFDSRQTHAQTKRTPFRQVHHVGGNKN